MNDRIGGTERRGGCAMTNGQSIAVIVGASEEEFAHARQCLPAWKYVAGPLRDDHAGVASIPERVSLILVHARKTEKETLAICEQFRNAPETSDTPIRLAISRYQIAQAHAVKRMGHAGFIMRPFDKKQMCDKITECFGISWVRTGFANTGER